MRANESIQISILFSAPIFLSAKRHPVTQGLQLVLYLAPERVWKLVLHPSLARRRNALHHKYSNPKSALRLQKSFLSRSLLHQRDAEAEVVFSQGGDGLVGLGGAALDSVVIP